MTDTPTASGSADVQAVRAILDSAASSIDDLLYPDPADSAMEVRQSARAVLVAISQLVLPALDAIEAERGRLQWINELLTARLAQMTETYNERGDRLLDASARLANAEAALREARTAEATPAPERVGEDAPRFSDDAQLRASLAVRDYMNNPEMEPFDPNDCDEIVAIVIQALGAATPTAPDRAADALRVLEASDDADWDFLLAQLGFGGRHKFWREMLTGLRAALQGDVGAGEATP
jgi:hypothetical protein